MSTSTVSWPRSADRWDRYGDLNPACIQVLNEIVARGQADDPRFSTVVLAISTVVTALLTWVFVA